MISVSYLFEFDIDTYSDHPQYPILKEFINKVPKEHDIKIKMFNHDLPGTEKQAAKFFKENPELVGKGYQASGSYNPRTDEIYVRGDHPNIIKSLSHEVAHKMDKDVRDPEDAARPFFHRKREYVARRFSERHDKPDEYGREFKHEDTIDASKRFADKLTGEERAKKFRGGNSD